MQTLESSPPKLGKVKGWADFLSTFREELGSSSTAVLQGVSGYCCRKLKLRVWMSCFKMARVVLSVLDSPRIRVYPWSCMWQCIITTRPKERFLSSKLNGVSQICLPFWEVLSAACLVTRQKAECMQSLAISSSAGLVNLACFLGFSTQAMACHSWSLPCLGFQAKSPRTCWATRCECFREKVAGKSNNW